MHWRTWGLDPSEFLHLLGKPPASRQHGSGVLLARGSLVQAETFPVLMDREIRADVRIHTRETLKSGRLHSTDSHGMAHANFAVFLDDSPSCTLLLDESTRKIMVDLVGLWQQRHRLRGGIHQASSTGYGWGPECWQAWYDMRHVHKGGKTLVISDFHGTLPSGPFWRHLLTQTDACVLQLCHSWPNLPNGTTVCDINNPGTNPKTWSNATFFRRHLEWSKELQQFRRKSPCLWHEYHEGKGSRELLVKILGALTA